MVPRQQEYRFHRHWQRGPPAGYRHARRCQDRSN
ncbi:hypothetical protein J7E73_06255 [Paenibacillus albidus]|nr:hypothetical protein [Paenibacillus albidus]